MIVSGTTRLFATFGNPNIGNPAPAVYNSVFAEHGADAVYVALEPDDIGAAMAAVRSLGLGGGTITAPFKQDVMRHLDEIDDDAAAIGAVNVVVNRGGTLVGRNSDWLGALGALRDVVDPAGRRIALLGAGGAARAVAYGLKAAGAEVVAFNRTVTKAQDLCERFSCSLGGDLEAVRPEFDVVVNATSVGMGDPDAPSLVGEEALSNVPVVFDLVVRPRETSLIRLALERGCVVVPGIAMVAHQAAPALKWRQASAPTPPRYASGSGEDSRTSTSCRRMTCARLNSAAPTCEPIRSAHGCCASVIRRTAQ